MDKLEKIFALQKSFNDDVIRTRGLTHVTDDEWIQKYMMAMFVEMGEMMNETNYKWWKNPKTVDQGAIKEELVDVLHFFVSVCLRAGMSAEELYNLYLQKNQENILRQQGKSDKKGYALGEASEPSL